MNQTQRIVLIGVLGVLLILTSVVLVAAFTAHTSTNTPTVEQPRITAQQAEQVAVSQLPGQVEEVELQRINGVLSYNVEIDMQGREFEVLVDATTGGVIDMWEETDVGAKEVELIQAKITQEQAQALALQVQQGTVSEVEIEKINNRYVYEIEIDAPGKEVDIAVDLQTGEIVSIEEELDETESVQQTAENTANAPITENQAITIALDAVGGGSAVEVDNDRFRGESAFEVEVRYNGDEYDVLVSKSTGQVLDIEEDD